MTPKKLKKPASKVAHNRPRPFFPTIQPRPQPTAQNWFFILWNLGTRHLFSYLCTVPHYWTDILAIFGLYFGRNDDFINSFWNLLTFNNVKTMKIPAHGLGLVKFCFLHYQDPEFFLKKDSFTFVYVITDLDTKLVSNNAYSRI